MSTLDGPAGSLVVASASPRRHELLRRLGLEFSVIAAEVDESVAPGEFPLAYVERVARAKAAAVVDRLGVPAGAVVLAADTTVDVDGGVLGKPIDDDDARRMLELLSGRAHRVHTAVIARRGGHTAHDIVTTEVDFVELDQAMIEWYLALGEHRDKAGAYAMQGAAGAFVVALRGSPTNVVGLPLAETVGVLRACGVELSPSRR